MSDKLAKVSELAAETAARISADALKIDTDGGNMPEPIASFLASTTPAAARGAIEIGAYNMTEPTIFFDDFDSADSIDSSIRPAPSGQTWTITGAGASHARLKNRTLTHVAPWTGAFYAWPTLAFSPRRVGCIFQVNQEAGASNGFVFAMAMTSHPLSLTNLMLHFTFNNATMSMEIWNGGGPVSPSTKVDIPFAQTLAIGQWYAIEWEIDPDTDTMYMYGPSGERLVYTDSRISDAFSPNIFFEGANAGAAAGRSCAFPTVWATAKASPRTHYEGRIAAALARVPRPILNVPFRVFPDQDGVFEAGRSKFGSVLGDFAGFGHFDHFSTVYKNAVTQDSFGQTAIGSSGASFAVSIYPNGVLTYQFHLNRFELRSGATLGIAFNPTDNATNKTYLNADTPDAARNIDLPNTSGKVVVLPPFADAAAAASGGLVSGKFFWNTTNKDLEQVP